MLNNIVKTREYNTQRAGNVVSNILGVRQSSGASIDRQQQWNRLSEMQKNIMRRKYKDSDHDGIPDCFDCQRNNPYRQDSVDSIENKRRLISDAEKIERKRREGLEKYRAKHFGKTQYDNEYDEE
jgi:hypothetical protein